MLLNDTLSLRERRNGTRLENTSPRTDVFQGSFEKHGLPGALRLAELLLILNLHMDQLGKVRIILLKFYLTIYCLDGNLHLFAGKFRKQKL